MDPQARFFDELAHGIIEAGGTARYDMTRAMALAKLAWESLQAMGEAFPAMWYAPEDDTLRFIYQWDHFPKVLTVMAWDDEMWQDMAVVRVPREMYQAK